jgi:DnaK suppressor protein
MANRYAPLKKRLVAERDRLQGELETLRAEEREIAEGDRSDNKGYGNHMADSASGVFDKEIDQAMERNLQVLLDDIGRALEKFEQGTYGVCDNCGQEIPYERLERFPQAALCVACKSEQEKQTIRPFRAAVEL